ncbi:TfoX/Sxy family DNA transformation protein [Listeria booriae]|uniref:TfoX/Sxy family DNA transformation protein n=1 Tax=Listeria booriae TaxID=1552123 RepID=UPI001C8AAAAC|nr:TfoX/Sxy family DNA transformation protein [Listeria booriae]
MAESIITLEEMPNIGDVLATRLRAAGIETPQELKRYGACLAFEKGLLSYPDACVNMLFALEGAIQNIRWHQLSSSTKKNSANFMRK